jgi:hypothetical protein
MGKDAHEGGDCCHACERFASTPAAPIERPEGRRDGAVISFANYDLRVVRR